MRVSPLAIVSALLLLGLAITGYDNLRLRQEVERIRAQKQDLSQQMATQTAALADQQGLLEEQQAAPPQQVAGVEPVDPRTAELANTAAEASAAPPQPVGPPLTLAEILRIDDEEVRATKLHAMVRDLVTSAVGLDEEQRQRLLRQLESHSPERMEGSLTPFLAAIIGQLPNNAGLIQQWQQSFASDPDRALIFSRLAGSNPSTNPADWQQLTEDWTPWEQDLYRNNMLRALAEQSPADALILARNNPGLFNDFTLKRMFREYADGQPQDFDQVLESLSDPHMREMAIAARAQALASQNTITALDWADNLPTQPERDRAHEVIYEATPRGIGALMRQEGGFPTIVEPMEGGPAMGNLKSGDRIVRITESDGTATDLYARPFREVIESIRGEPGTSVTLKVLRWDEASGEMGELDVTLNRQQLYIDSTDGQG